MTSARVASIRSQSRPGARRLLVARPGPEGREDSTVIAVSLPRPDPARRRHDRAVVEELRQLRGRGRAWGRRPRGAHGLALDAVQRLPDGSDAVARGAGAGAGL